MTDVAQVSPFASVEQGSASPPASDAPTGAAGTAVPASPPRRDFGAPGADVPVETLLDMWERMLVIRGFEERASAMYRDGDIPGFVHLSIGQEATSVGACWPLRPDDGIVSNHRGHGHVLAKGVDLTEMFAELMGRSTGSCGGLGGSMHIADVTQGIYGANGIVGAGLPIAVGVAEGFRQLGSDGVVVAFFGDGAVTQGAFHEAVNLASIWDLPVIFVCENNGFAEMSSFDSQHPVPVVERGAAYGIESIQLDGNDIEVVASTVNRLVDERRSGRTGPALVEAITHRRHGHYEGDQQRYREKLEADAWDALDPIQRAARRLVERGIEPERLDALRADVAERLALAEAHARQAPFTEMAAVRASVEGPRSVQHESPAPVGPSDYRMMDAVHDALEHSLVDDPTVWLAGIDIAGGGNVFGLTRGLSAEFPDRVLDTPISETAILGCAVGAAMAGSRPVVEVMYLDFIGVAFDQLLNQAAKIRFMTGGRTDVPLVVRTQFGSGRSSGAQHSQSLEALLAHIPGLTVVMPSSPADTYGLLRAAIADPNPVVFIDHRLLYGVKGPRPDREHVVPIGKGVVRRPGRHLTVATWSRCVLLAVEAAERLADEGIEVEVLDMRTVAPLDVDLVAESVRRTSRLAIVHDAVITGGLGAEIAAQVADACFWDLDAPIARIAPEFLPAPYSPEVESEWVMDVDTVVDRLRSAARI